MRKAGDALSDFMHALGIHDPNNALGLFSSWKRIAGEQLSMVARPVDIRGHVLLLEVAHPGWITRLQFQEKELLAKLQKEFPKLEIQSLAFRQARDGSTLSEVSETTETEASVEPAKNQEKTEEKAPLQQPNLELTNDLQSALARLKKTL